MSPRSLTTSEWTDITRRNARSVQTLIGWIFWDPGAVTRYEELGLRGPLGYIASRAAPFAGAGPKATTAAFGSISPVGIDMVFSLLATPAHFLPFWEARNAAVLDGLAAYAPDSRAGLRDLGPALWEIVSALPSVGRPFYASHLQMERSDNDILSGWHAVNCLREWRGDTHWSIVASLGLSGGEASILHNAWLGYDGDWLSRSRGNDPADIDRAWTQLEEKSFAAGRTVTDAGLRLRQWIEDETDEHTSLVWRLAGLDLAERFHDAFEPPCELLLARVDETAGTQYQPASRIQSGYHP